MDSNEKNVTTLKDSNDLKAILSVIQAKTFKFILYFCCIGIFLVFAASILNREENKYYEVANAMNMLISIIVGIVAMVMSVISLFFSFYNTKQSYDTHDDYLEKFINITNSLNQTMKRQEDYIRELNILSNKLNLVDDKISAKFDKMYDMINSLDKASFNQVTPKVSPWLDDIDETDWDIDDEDE